MKKKLSCCKFRFSQLYTRGAQINRNCCQVMQPRNDLFSFFLRATPNLKKISKWGSEGHFLTISNHRNILSRYFRKC